MLAILPAIKRLGARLIAFTGSANSTLGRLADAHLNTAVAKEAGPLNLAPTASTTAQLAFGDALAVALFDAKGFGADDFARSHPGGTLGRKLLVRVRDVMRTGSAVPSVPASATLGEAVIEMSARRMGMTAVINADGSIAGVFTDGDLRRALERIDNVKTARVADVMTKGPATIHADALAAEAVHLMEERKINQLLVASPDGRLAGALNMHDLFHAKVV